MELNYSKQSFFPKFLSSMIPKTIQDMISDIFKNYSRLQAEKLSRIVFCDANMFSLASSRCSVSQGAVQKTGTRKNKSAARGSERMPVGKLNKRLFRYTRIWYTLWFVQVKCLREEQKDCIKIWSIKDSFAIRSTGFRKSYERFLCNPFHWFLEEFNLSTAFQG